MRKAYFADFERSNLSLFCQHHKGKMKVKPLSYKDIVKLAVHELNQGSTLDQVEEDLLKKNIERKEALKAIEEADYYKKQEELKAKKKAELAEASKKQQTQAEEKKETAQTQQTKSSFWLWVILIVLIGIALYLYFSGTITFK